MFLERSYACQSLSKSIEKNEYLIHAHRYDRGDITITNSRDGIFQSQVDQAQKSIFKIVVVIHRQSSNYIAVCRVKKCATEKDLDIDERLLLPIDYWVDGRESGSLNI